MTISAGPSNDGAPDLTNEVGEALDRVLSLGLGDSSERQRNLLRYLVIEEVQGRGDRLKAYSIATDVFGRSADFDAQQDSIVRVEIGRLRKSLELYYATAGRLDRVKLAIEKGQYRPTFQLLDQDAAQSPARFGDGFVRLLGAVLLVAAIAAGVAFWFSAGARRTETRQGPRIAIAPFVFAADRDGQDYVGAGLRAELTSILSEFDWLTVFPIARPIDPATGDKPANWRIDFLVKANVQIAGETIIVSPVLLDGATGAVRWSGRYETPFHAQDVVAMQRQIATKIAADVGQPFGAVANLELTRAALDTFSGDDAYRCSLRALQFWTSFRRADFDRAMECAGKLGGSSAAAPNLRGLLALLKLDSTRFAFDAGRREKILADAPAIASDAHQRDDKGAIARMARYSSALCSGDVETFRRIGLAATRDYPNNPATLLDVGGKLALGAGDWKDGLELVARARALASNVPDYFDIAGVVDAMRRRAPIAAGDVHAAALETSHPLLLLVDVAVQNGQHNADAADVASARLAALGYDSPAALAKLLDGQCWSNEVKTELGPRLAAATAH